MTQAPPGYPVCDAAKSQACLGTASAALGSLLKFSRHSTGRTLDSFYRKSWCWSSRYDACKGKRVATMLAPKQMQPYKVRVANRNRYQDCAENWVHIKVDAYVLYHSLSESVVKIKGSTMTSFAAASFMALEANSNKFKFCSVMRRSKQRNDTSDADTSSQVRRSGQ